MDITNATLRETCTEKGQKDDDGNGCCALIACLDCFCVHFRFLFFFCSILLLVVALAVAPISVLGVQRWAAENDRRVGYG